VRVLATIAHLLNQIAIRVGDEPYAGDNASFGLTTLRNAPRYCVSSFVRRAHKNVGEISISLSERRPVQPSVPKIDLERLQ
jgi:DNA topoisomerase I